MAPAAPSMSRRRSVSMRSGASSQTIIARSCLLSGSRPAFVRSARGSSAARALRRFACFAIPSPSCCRGCPSQRAAAIAVRLTEKEKPQGERTESVLPVHSAGAFGPSFAAAPAYTVTIPLVSSPDLRRAVVRTPHALDARAIGGLGDRSFRVQVLLKLGGGRGGHGVADRLHQRHVDQHSAAPNVADQLAGLSRRGQEQLEECSPCGGAPCWITSQTSALAPRAERR